VPLAPCTAIAALPVEALADAAIASVAVPPLGTVNGLCGLDVTPDGMPLSVTYTSPENPCSACTLT